MEADSTECRLFGRTEGKRTVYGKYFNEGCSRGIKSDEKYENFWETREFFMFFESRRCPVFSIFASIEIIIPWGSIR